MIRSLVVIPGRAPHWVSDHARHLAQRLTDNGRVMVVYTHAAQPSPALPGQPGNASVLGHSVAGYPLWTGRLRSALGLRPSGHISVIVLWREANHFLALWSAIVARLHREAVVLDIPELDTSRLTTGQRMVRTVLCRLASRVVQGEASAAEAGKPRAILALCGADEALASLVMHTFEGMSDAAANRWRLILQVDDAAIPRTYDGTRRTGRVSFVAGEPSIDVLRSSDVLIADFAGRYEDFVHQAVLSGGAGVLVGQPVAGRIARCHDGVWFAQRDSASILVALEASSGDLADRPGSVKKMRELANEVIQVVEHEVAA